MTLEAEAQAEALAEVAAVEALERAAEETGEEAEARVATATTVIALGNIVSRVLGLIRETLLSNLFGAGAAVDAFNVAIIVPRTLDDLLIRGHVNSALVPVLSEFAAQKDRTALWQLVNLLLGAATAALAVLVLALEVFAPGVVALVSGGAPAESQALAVHLLRVTAPALLFLSLFAVVSGLLYALRRFTLPAFAGAVFNGCIVVVAVLAAPTLGITAMAVGWLVGAVVQLALQFPALRDAHLMPTLRGILRNKGLRRLGQLYVPVMLSLIIDMLGVRLVSYNLASQAGEASISYMNYATTLIQFPHGLVATAISLAILPTLSRQAAALTSGVTATYKDTLGRGLRLSVVLIVPATIGLFVLATPIVALLFEHGAFTALDTNYTALALRLYLLGLPFAAVDLLLVFAFYAQQDTLTPAVVGIISLLAYMVVALGLMPKYGLFSLMIADSVKHLLHTVISGWLLARRIGWLRGQGLPTTVLKTSIAALLMGGAVYAMQQVILAVMPQTGFISEVTLVGVTSLTGALVFWLLARWMHIDDFFWLTRSLRKRFSRA